MRNFFVPTTYTHTYRLFGTVVEGAGARRGLGRKWKIKGGGRQDRSPKRGRKVGWRDSNGAGRVVILRREVTTTTRELLSHGAHR